MAGPEGPAYMRKDGYFMKAMKRRLLSLLLAMAMVCSLVPTALADGDTADGLTVTARLENGTISLSASAKEGYNVTGNSYSWTCSDNTITVSGTTSTASVTVTDAMKGKSFTFTASVAGSQTDNQSVTTLTGTSSSVNIPSDTPAVTRVSLSPKTLDFAAGVTAGQSLSATVEGTNVGSVNPTWKVSPAGVVSLSSNSGTSITVTPITNNTATAKTATITVTAGSETDTCSVTVQPTSTTPTISLSANGSTVEVNKTLNLTVTTANATGLTVAFDISGTGNGSVTGNSSPYAFTATEQGAVSIVAKLMEGQKKVAESASVSVTVTASSVTNIPVKLTPTSIAVGETAVAEATIPANLAYDTVVWTSSNDSLATVTARVNKSLADVRAYATGKPVIKVQLKKGATVVGEGSATLTVSGTALSITTSQLSGYPGYNATTRTFSSLGSYAQAQLVGAPTNWQNNYTISWSSDNRNIVDVYNSGNATAQLVSVGKGTATITATLTPTANSGLTTPLKAVTTVKVDYNYQLNPTVTVYRSEDYNLNDTDSKNTRSIIQQIINSTGISSSYYYAYVTFSDVTTTGGHLTAQTTYDYYIGNIPSGMNTYRTGLLSDIDFIPDSSSTATKAEFRFTLTTTNGYGQSANTYTGLMTFNITGESSTGDIPYTASIGDDVPFDIGDFEDFYYSKTSRGTLEYVTFSMPSGGYLYSDRSRLSASNATCYVSPRSTQNDLGSVYFSPSGTTASKAGTVRVNFTAYGNRNGNSGVSGTVAITYLNGAAKDISYSTVGGSVTLDPQDFIDAYKEVTGKTAPSNLTIQFQEVPANGTLTYTGGSRDVDLTKSNVRSNKYSTKTTGTYRLNQLTYTGTKGKDTVAYIAYNGSTAQFTGNVVFNGTAAVPTDVVVTYGSTGGQAVVFSQNDFIRANSVMSNAVKVRFVTPANGTLTMNGSNAAGIDVSTSLLGSVTYKPKAGFNNNTDRITFVAYDSRNQLVASGSVNITVVGNTSTTTTPGGVTDVSQFKDVSSTAWYRSDLDTLVKAGVITGKGEGKFDPKGTVTYGEALKMVLEACNHTAAVGTGSQWAINYKNLAVSRGWISSSIDLNAPITRNATAELAAKVMGVAPATSGSPFADEANAYAVALYYTNPQIFYGTTNPNGGKPLFENNKPLLREQVCAVICRVRTYNAQQTTDTMPDGI